MTGVRQCHFSRLPSRRPAAGGTWLFLGQWRWAGGGQWRTATECQQADGGRHRGKAKRKTINIKLAANRRNELVSAILAGVGNDC